MKNNKEEVAIQIYKSIDKSLDKLIESNAKKYLKKLKNKRWYSIALKKYKSVSKSMLESLKGQAKKYGKAIEGKKLFKKKKVKKDDEDDLFDDLFDDIKDIEDGTNESQKTTDDIYDETVNDEIKDAIEDITKEIIDESDDYYEEEIEETVIDAAKEVAKNLDIKLDFNKFNKFTRDYLRDKKIYWSKQVAETTEKRIKEILVKGFEEGLSSYDIAERIYNDYLFGYNRSETIARTEIISSCNYADNVIWNFDDNIVGKEWSAIGDERSRLTHSLASGQKVPKDKPFIIGGYKLMHPGDSSLGALASEIVNCRCTMFPVFKGESLKSNTIYDDKDVGTVEWLKRQSDKFQLNYLGGKKKLELFKYDKLKSNQLLKPFHEIVSTMTEKDGIIKKREARSIREISGATPYEKIDLYNPKLREYDKRRIFDKNGKANYDFDLNVHRNLKQHKIAPHIHPWNNGKKEKGYRIATLEQVKNNKDIFLKAYSKEYYNKYIESYKIENEDKRRIYLETITKEWWYDKIHSK